MDIRFGHVLSADEQHEVEHAIARLLDKTDPDAILEAVRYEVDPDGVTRMTATILAAPSLSEQIMAAAFWTATQATNREQAP